jgi:hypothetical protein
MSNDPASNGHPGGGPLLDQRAALILLIALLVATAASILTWFWHQSTPEAALGRWCFLGCGGPGVC